MAGESKRRFFWVGLYAVAMGWFEAALVIYLRLLYYPDGFQFPLKQIPLDVFGLELGREAATLLMLVAVGVLAGRSALERFGFFIYAFGIWDIVYYIVLRLFEGWPESLLSWDLLFLIPLPWIGPVLAPVLVSLAMIGACVVIVIQEERGRPLRPSVSLWAIEILCGLVIIFSFIVDYPVAIESGVPERFRWELFLLGYVPGVALFLNAWWRTNRGAG